MEPILDFKTLTARLRELPDRKRVAVVCPHDSHTEYVIMRSLEEGFAEFTIFSDKPGCEVIANITGKHPANTRVVEASTPDDAARMAVEMVRQKKADVLMKGNINTDNLLRAVLNKECGLLPPGRVLSHITMTEAPAYKKLLAFTDVAVIPRPNLMQYDAMMGYAVDVCRRLGNDAPKVALVHCTEKVNEKFPHTLCYEELKRRAKFGRYGNVVVDGPMDIKTACDCESGSIKGISSPVVGDADVVIFPNIESGNVFYKTVTLFGHGEIAAMLCGTIAPVVVTSRADSGESKYNSLALACLAG